MWSPISRKDFEELLNEQQSELDDESRRAFARFTVPLHTAIILRTEIAGDEKVFVIAHSPEGAVYFDDVEYGFNFSPVDENSCIEQLGGDQLTLAETVQKWLIPQMKDRDARPKD